MATTLRDAQATDMLEDLKVVKDALFDSNFENQGHTVRRAIEYLEQIKPPLWKTAWKWVTENIWFSIFISLYVLWIIAWLITFWLRALTLLRINRALKPFDFQLPKQFGAIKLPIRYLLFIGFLNYHPRVLDTWVKKYMAIFKKRFSEKTTVDDRKIHITLPVELDRKTIPDLTPKSLRPTFSRQLGCMLIWGEGGSGKTSIACQIAKWAMAEDKDNRLCEHLMLPVLIEQELSTKEDHSALINAVGRQLQDMTDQANPIADELLERLLRQRRVLVIVDHLSEMSTVTRNQINPAQRDFPANAFIVTSRLEEPLGGVTKTVIKPLRIAGKRLSSFMEAYLTQKGKRELFDDPEFFDACRRLSKMVGDRDITLLLAKLYAEQLIGIKEGLTEDKLPDNIPDLMLSYLNELNRNVSENKLEDRTVHRDAKILAWKCLKDTYRPANARIDDAITSLDKDDAGAHLKYLEDNLRLIKTDPVTKDRFKFLLDPLAEYLAGLHIVELYGDQEDSWKRFLEEADKKEGAPETIKGFLLAVRDCIIAKGEEAKIHNFMADELAKRAGLDLEALEKARLEQRIQRRINELGFPDDVDRIQAAAALGKFGPEAREAVPALVGLLKDKNNEVREAAAWAIAYIGPDNAAVSALIEAQCPF
jgi:HEAT repeat protein